MDLSRIRCLVKIASMSNCALPKKTCKLQLLCRYRIGDGAWGEGPREWCGRGRQKAACAETCSIRMVSVQQGDTINTAWQSYVNYL